MPSPIKIKSPLPADDLIFASMAMQEGISVLGEMQLELLSPKADLKPDDLLGEPLTVSVALAGDKQRHFNGHVTRFAIGRHRGRHFGYQATVRPWLWILTRTSDCRIFMDKTVRQIVETVFADHPSANFKFSLFRTYHPWTYCVQYRETDYNFVARLLEQEGIYWYFEHSEGAHKLVLVDSSDVNNAKDAHPDLPYVEEGGALPDTEHVSSWSFSRQVTTGKVALTSYDFERPSTRLDVNHTQTRKHAMSDQEVFDYDGDYVQKADGEQWAEDSMNELQSHYEQLQGASNAHGIEAGKLLGLRKHPREDQNATYLVTQTVTRGHAGISESGGDPGDFRCEFLAIPAAQQFRPTRLTPKPSVQGPQSAVVTGPAGEEIFADKYGRVKVQFHWDRLGKKNEKSSCWVRVSHPWAGKSFGMVHTPRIGQEVIVDFLEGDPDQPIITGRVYNAEQMPPWELPANATQSGILTRSSKGGSVANANALRFEDKKGSEQVWLHAEKNQEIEVENDETHWVGHDRTKTIDHDETVHVKHDRTETVDHDETITIHHDRKETVDNDEILKIGRDQAETIGRDRQVAVGKNHTETIAVAMSLTVGSTLTESIGVNHSETVGGAMELTVGGAIVMTAGAAMAISVGAVMSEAVGGSKTQEIGASKNVTIGADLTETIAGKHSSNIQKGVSQTIGEDLTVDVKKNYTATAKKVQIVAEDEITLKTGSAELVMKKNGDITIKGGKIKIEASSDMVLKGSKIKEN